MKKKARKRKRSTEPSAESLREIPELSKDAVVLGRGAEGLQRAKEFLRSKQGAPDVPAPDVHEGAAEPKDRNS